MMATLYVFCGLPGAGKSTWASQHLAHAVIASADEIRISGMAPGKAFARFHAKVRGALGRGQDTVADACSLRQRERSVLLECGRSFNARCELVLFDVPTPVCRERDCMREKRAAVDWRTSATLMGASMATARTEGWDAVHVVR
jgi:predicted kinase